MANTIPCPNPTCAHQFSPTELQAAAQLACPRCGFKMQGQAPVKPAVPVKSAPAKPAAQSPSPNPKPPIAAPMPAKPLASPPMASPPMAKPIAAPMPAAPASQPAPAESVSDGAFFDPDVGNDGGALLRTSSPRVKRPFNWMKLAIVLLSLGFAGSIVLIFIGAIFLGFGFGLSKDGSGPDPRGSVFYGQIKGQKEGNEKVFKLVLNKDEWEIDRDVQTRFEAHQAWRRKQTDHDFWFAVVVQDFVSSKPRDAEMLRIAIDKLESYFTDTLELEKKAEPAKVKDLAAQKIQFKGQMKSANWLGECYMFFNNGVGYWLFVASPDWATVEYFADDLPKKNFFIESERRGWREQPAPMETYASVDKKITVDVLKKVWEKHPNPKDLDENGILYLSGKYMKAKDNRKNASMLVFTIEKKEDAKATLKAAREYVESKAKNENETYKIALASEVTPGQTEAGAAESVGNRPGRILDLKRLAGEELQRYYLLAIAHDGDSAYGILGDCIWDSRQIWRQDFLDVMRSMHFTKGE